MSGYNLYSNDKVFESYPFLPNTESPLETVPYNYKVNPNYKHPRNPFVDTTYFRYNKNNRFVRDQKLNNKRFLTASVLNNTFNDKFWFNNNYPLTSQKGPNDIPRFNYYSKYPRITSTLRTATKDTSSGDAQNDLFDVTKYGALGDGVTDDTQAIATAIAAALANKPKKFPRTTLLFPDNKRFLITQIVINNPTDFQFQVGMKTTIQMKKYDQTHLPKGIQIINATNFVLEGYDASLSYLHGAGNSLEKTCGGRQSYIDSNEIVGDGTGIFITFPQANKVLVRNVSFFHAPSFHLVFKNGCTQIEVYQIRIQAPANSSNTDGLHFDDTVGGTFYNSFVCNGDDCVAMNCTKPSGEVEIHHLTLTSGHGISFGSHIGDLYDTVYIHDINATGLINGIRFKSSTDQNGTVSNCVVENFTMKRVENAIVVQNGSYSTTPTGNLLGLNNVYGNPFSFNGVGMYFKSQQGASLKNILLHNLSGDTVERIGQLSCGSDAQCQNVTFDTLNFTNITKVDWECDGTPNITVTNSNVPFKCSKKGLTPSSYSGSKGEGCTQCKDCSF